MASTRYEIAQIRDCADTRIYSGLYRSICTPERGLLVQREVAQVHVGALTRLLARSQIVLVHQVHQSAEAAVRREAARIVSHSSLPIQWCFILQSENGAQYYNKTLNYRAYQEAINNIPIKLWQKVIS